METTSPIPISHPASRDPWAVRAILLTFAIGFAMLFLLVPLLAVFFEAFQKGLTGYCPALQKPAAQSAIQLTLVVAAIAVPANLIFSVAASWAIAKFGFPGKTALISLTDLPSSVSPVTSGFSSVLLFGS